MNKMEMVAICINVVLFVGFATIMWFGWRGQHNDDR
jgi:hypothetical protein